MSRSRASRWGGNKPKDVNTKRQRAQRHKESRHQRSFNAGFLCVFVPLVSLCLRLWIYSNAKTKTLLELLGFNSGVRRISPVLTSEFPTLTATYCFPPTEYVIG